MRGLYLLFTLFQLEGVICGSMVIVSEFFLVRLPVLTVTQGSHERVLIIVYIVSIRCCDKCDMWFHGDCIGITKDEAQMIRHFYCKTCLGNVYSTCIYCYKHLDD